MEKGGREMICNISASFIKCLLDACYSSGTILGAEGVETNGI